MLSLIFNTIRVLSHFPKSKLALTSSIVSANDTWWSWHRLTSSVLMNNLFGTIFNTLRQPWRNQSHSRQEPKPVKKLWSSLVKEVLEIKQPNQSSAWEKWACPLGGRKDWWPVDILRLTDSSAVGWNQNRTDNESESLLMTAVEVERFTGSLLLTVNGL